MFPLNLNINDLRHYSVILHYPFQRFTGEWSSGSKMDSNNLATVFAPNILHCIKPGSNKELSTERAEERIDVINVIRSMIDHNKELFQVLTS
jgi:hypothetical protein